MRSLLCAVAILVALPSPTLAAKPAAKVKARALFTAGKAAYAEGNYAEAVKSFEAGFQLDPLPAFLLNIAQSYRSAGDPRRAVEHYRKFLVAQPTTPLRAQVEELIRELDAQVTAATPPPETRPLAAPLPQPLPPPPPRRSPFYKTWWFWTAVTAVVGTTVGLAAWAGTREPDYVKQGGLGAVHW